MRGRIVRLTGTWVRAKTEPYELTDFRQTFYRLNRECSLKGYGDRLSFVAHHQKPEDLGARRGTFDVTVIVRVPGKPSLFPERRMTVAAAKLELQARLRALMCRVPKLTFASAEVGKLAE